MFSCRPVPAVPDAVQFTVSPTERFSAAVVASELLAQSHAIVITWFWSLAVVVTSEIATLVSGTAPLLRIWKVQLTALAIGAGFDAPLLVEAGDSEPSFNVSESASAALVCFSTVIAGVSPT